MKTGDDVFFFYTSFGKNYWGEHDTIVCPNYLELMHGKIVNMSEIKDYIHVYVEGVQQLICFGYCFHKHYIFESPQEAMNKMNEKLLDFEEIYFLNE